MKKKPDMRCQAFPKAAAASAQMRAMFFHFPCSNRQT